MSDTSMSGDEWCGRLYAVIDALLYAEAEDSDLLRDVAWSRLRQAHAEYGHRSGIAAAEARARKAMALEHYPRLAAESRDTRDSDREMFLGGPGLATA